MLIFIPRPSVWEKARSQMEVMGPNWQVDELSRVVILFRSKSNREINSKCHMVSEGSVFVFIQVKY